jgi:hypothetical protein
MMASRARTNLSFLSTASSDMMKSRRRKWRCENSNNDKRQVPVCPARKQKKSGGGVPNDDGVTILELYSPAIVGEKLSAMISDDFQYIVVQMSNCT